MWDLSNTQNIWYLGQWAVLFILMIIGVYLILLSRKSDFKSQKAMFIGLSLFLWVAVINQFAFVISMYLESYSAYNVKIFPQVILIGGGGYIWILLMCFALGFIPLMYPIEKYVLQVKRLWITPLNIVTFFLVLIPFILTFFITNPTLRTELAYPGLVFFVLSGLISFFGPCFIYIRVGMQSSGIVKTKSFLMGFGLLLIYIAILVGSEVKQYLGGYLSLFGPIVLIIGLWMVLRGLTMQ